MCVCGVCVCVCVWGGGGGGGGVVKACGLKTTRVEVIWEKERKPTGLPNMRVILFLWAETQIFSGWWLCHYSDVIMGAMTYQITSLTIVYSTVYSGAYQRKHQSPASLAFVRGIHRWPVNSHGQWLGKCFNLMTSSCAGRLSIKTPLIQSKK